MKEIFYNNRGEGYIDTGIKLVIAIVVGALILGGIYLIFIGDGGVMDRLDSEVEGMMDYTQELRYERYYNESSQKYELRYSYDGKHWKTPNMPVYNSSATVYGTMSNNSDNNPIEAALIQDGNNYYVIASTDGGITWLEQLSFRATAITHCYYGSSTQLPTTSGSFSGEKFVIRYKNGSYFTIQSDGTTWDLPIWSDFSPMTPVT